jgi:hypothetical protein
VFCIETHLSLSPGLKFSIGGASHIGEVQFFFRSDHSGAERAYALVSVWSEPDQDLLQESINTVYLCAYTGQADLRVIDAKVITSVVAMVPMTPRNGDQSSQFFLLEKPGLEITRLGDVDTSVCVE